MYMILKQASNTENVWSFHTENGVLWNTNNVTEAITKIEHLMETSGVSSVRLVRNMQFSATVEVEPETPNDPDPVVDQPVDEVP